MSNIEFKVDSDAFKRSLEQYPKKLVTELRRASKRSASVVEASAKSTHRFTSRKGDLVKSIKGYGGVGYTSGEGESLGQIRGKKVAVLDSRDSLASAYVELILHDEGHRLGTKYGKYVHGGFGSWAEDKFIEKAMNSHKAQIQANWDIAISKVNRSF
jgi:hypothetical protein